MVGKISERTSGKDRLTSGRLENLLHSLALDRHRAAAKYEELQWKLRRFFEWNCAAEAQELVDETLDRVAQKLDQQQIRDVGAFAWGIAQKIRMEANKRTQRLVPIADSPAREGFSPAVMDTEEKLNSKVDQDRQRARLQGCIQELSETDRRLFVAYYCVDDADAVRARERLAAHLGLTMNALRVRASRLRDRVERCCIACRSAKAVNERTEATGVAENLAITGIQRRRRDITDPIA